MHEIGRARAITTQGQSLTSMVEELGGQMLPFLSPGWTTLRCILHDSLDVSRDGEGQVPIMMTSLIMYS